MCDSSTEGGPAQTSGEKAWQREFRKLSNQLGTVRQRIEDIMDLVLRSETGNVVGAGVDELCRTALEYLTPAQHVVHAWPARWTDLLSLNHTLNVELGRLQEQKDPDAQLTEQIRENVRLRDRVRDLENENDRLSNAAVDLELELAERRLDVDNLDGKAASLEAENRELSDRVASLDAKDAEIGDLCDRIEEGAERLERIAASHPLGTAETDVLTVATFLAMSRDQHREKTRGLTSDHINALHRCIMGLGSASGDRLREWGVSESDWQLARDGLEVLGIPRTTPVVARPRGPEPEIGPWRGQVGSPEQIDGLEWILANSDLTRTARDIVDSVITVLRGPRETPVPFDALTHQDVEDIKWLADDSPGAPQPKVGVFDRLTDLVARLHEYAAGKGAALHNVHSALASEAQLEVARAIGLIRRAGNVWSASETQPPVEVSDIVAEAMASLQDAARKLAELAAPPAGQDDVAAQDLHEPISEDDPSPSSLHNHTIPGAMVSMARDAIRGARDAFAERGQGWASHVGRSLADAEHALDAVLALPVLLSDPAPDLPAGWPAGLDPEDVEGPFLKTREGGWLDTTAVESVEQDDGNGTGFPTFASVAGGNWLGRFERGPDVVAGWIAYVRERWERKLRRPDVGAVVEGMEVLAPKLRELVR